MNSQRVDFVAVLALVTTLVACKSLLEDDSCTSLADCKNGFVCESGKCVPRKDPPATASAASAPTPVAAEKAPTPIAAGAETEPKEDDNKGIPLVPTTKSKPPTIPEWKAAAEVNTQGPNSRPEDCAMKIVREWLKVDCFGDVVGYERMDKFGRKNIDYFEHFKPGKLGSFVVRLKKGTAQKVRICRRKDMASLFVNWPGQRDRPIHVALGKGPACENPSM